VIAQSTGDPVLGYVVVFGIMAAFMLISLLMLSKIDVGKFQKSGEQSPVVERAALAGEA